VTFAFSPQSVARLAPNGVLRAAINLGNPVLAQRKDNDDLAGVSVELARELARQLGVKLEFVVFNAAGKVFEALASDGWDIAFLAIDPLRSEQIAFTSAYVLIEGTYLVRHDAPYQGSHELDRDGARISVGTGSAYDLYLTRNLKHAHIERYAGAALAFDSFLEQGLDAAAGVRQVLDALASLRDDLRVLDDSFMTISQAIGVPKARGEAAALLESFIEAMKAQGFVYDALLRSGQTGVTVASATGRR
jgi:polar amino acid transport system substrate-binding protein